MTFNDVLSFWFDEIEQSQWWVKDLAFDELIKKRFCDIHQQASMCELVSWRQSAKGRLAEIIILDQFSRNIYRDTPKAFFCDSMALTLAQEAIARQEHLNLNNIERSFLYMPFMHSESLLIHDKAVELFADNAIQSSINFEKQHRDIIVRFGRYPHRNSILNRHSTYDELAFLQQPNSSF